MEINKGDKVYYIDNDVYNENRKLNIYLITLEVINISKLKQILILKRLDNNEIYKAKIYINLGKEITYWLDSLHCQLYFNFEKCKEKAEKLLKLETDLRLNLLNEYVRKHLKFPMEYVYSLNITDDKINKITKEVRQVMLDNLDLPKLIIV